MPPTRWAAGAGGGTSPRWGEYTHCRGGPGNEALPNNPRGPIICTRAVLDEMIKNGYGKIVSIASDAGRVGSTGEAGDSAAKGGRIALPTTMAREVGRP